MAEFNLEELTMEEIADAVRNAEDDQTGKEFCREVCKQLDLTYSNNAPVANLKKKILDELVEPEVVAPAVKVTAVAEPKKKKASDYTNAELLNMKHEDTKDELLKRRIIRAKAMRLYRVRITNLDPNDADVPGAIVTVYTKYTGKVSKLIPYGEENEHGYHIEKILLDELRSRKFVMRKEIKRKGSSFGVKQYKASYANKFSIELLPELSKTELNDLAKAQAAKGSVDNSGE